ncbi:Clavaminate synthase-like protein [Auricularia subglabra TFB-10046 SS5]|uniref:Clavaminate synthase-like protein n=1 Tax=Auricularia subglabra (strain TFB-10046 / SS5) TaxID=717982 RepID=J0WX97_AURST|nr:Clavaminate synthase-like protein [Auricularia subglabra TFB-10046 SS5]
METLEVPHVRHYEAAPPTTADLEWADLPTVDLLLARTPEGMDELTKIVKTAMRVHGFLYVINHGLTPEQNARMFDIADIPFSGATDADKQTYLAPMKESGSYQGYKPRQYWHIDSGVKDEIETYSINRDVTKREHPEVLRPFLPEISAFAKFNHFHVLHPLLRLFARAVDLPEDAFVNIHGYDAVGETYVRSMKYYPRSEEDEKKVQQVWLKGHTDIGTVTILWSQPVSALQVLSPNNTWRWVKHVPNALVVNAGDALEFLSGGRLRATIHRVRQPPPDQRGRERLGIFYFAMADDDVVIAPMVPNEEKSSRFTAENVMTMAEWRQARTRAYGHTKLVRNEREKGVEEEVINGVLVRHYN